MKNIYRGIFLFIFAWTIIPIMDGIAKYLSQIGIPVLQIVWARYFFTCVLVLPIIIGIYKRNSFKSDNHLLQIFRGSFLVGATLTFFYAISIIPLANALALAFFYPAFMTLLSHFFLNDKINFTSVFSVVAGLIGVLFIVKPGFQEFNFAFLASIGTGLFYALYMVSTKKLSNVDTPLKTLSFTGLVGLISMSLMMPFVWVSPSIYEWFLMLSMGLVASIGHFLIILSFRYVKASILAPFSYWEIITNIIIGYYFFKDIPDKFTWIGIVIIIGSGIYILFQTRNLKYEK
ncbi:MAG: Riboflavin transporter [Alphaproteobacteria bacterium MarineAlpha5_Bin12]|nr:hypothetical protein [Pelagibacteraceae bacterium]PPR42013.1 MAG: Riboflavin transporter [Alphaproteobacteria bacterium MarineAlpha5_Bin12]|tara:strand:- start:3672 stop:4538 length:867 start_codon:yes stop_codon:yes gene_type:complete